jgi:lysylphosphatidylglycerol synthetase-like protein (DUF2156 family)
MVVGLLLDVAFPVATYYALHLLGATDWVALLAAAAAAVLRILVVAVRHRRLNQFALIMLIVYGLGVLLAFASGDPRTLLLRNSLITACIGAVFLITAAGRRPLTLTALQSFAPARSEALARQFAHDPTARRGFRLAAVVWGCGLVAEALARLPLVYALPLPVAVAATEALLLLTIAALAGWTTWYLRRNDQHLPFS